MWQQNRFPPTLGLLITLVEEEVGLEPSEKVGCVRLLVCTSRWGKWEIWAERDVYCVPPWTS